MLPLEWLFYGLYFHLMAKASYRRIVTLEEVDPDRF